MKFTHVKKGDTVKVLADKEKGKTGVISKSMPSEGKVVIEGLNLVKRNKKSTVPNKAGAIVETAMPIDASNVAKVK